MDWQHIGFDWNQARAFLATAEEGSFSAAARSLGVAQPTVGRQVAALEQELGVTLVERSGRGLRLTTAGLDVAAQLRIMGEAATRASLIAAGQVESLEGLVSITASEVTSAYLLPPIVAQLRATYPGIELEVVASNEAQNLRKREADIAVRNFRPRDPELVATKIQDGAGYLYASPAYLDRVGWPTSIADVGGLEIYGFDHTPLMLDALKALGFGVSEKSFPVVTSQHLVQWEMTKAGWGACVMMQEIGDRESAVCRVIEDQPPLPVPMWVTSHRELKTGRRMRVVFDALVDGLRAAVTPQ